MKIEIKPCPFCGEKEKLSFCFMYERPRFYCETCSAMIGYSIDSVTEILMKWNTRYGSNNHDE